MKKLGTLAMLAAICAAFIGVVPARAVAGCIDTDFTLGRSCGYFVPQRLLPLRFEYNAGSAPENLTKRGDSGNTLGREAIDGALAAWNALWPLKSSDPACPALCYEGTTTRHAGIKDGHNVIEFVDDFSICNGGDLAGLACAWYEGDTGTAAYKIKEVDILLSSAFKWNQPFVASADAVLGEAFGITGGSTNWVDLQSVLTHELGHGLGLEHPKADGDYPRRVGELPWAMQTMYGGEVLRGSTNKRTPEAGDTAALLWTATLSQRDA